MLDKTLLTVTMTINHTVGAGNWGMDGKTGLKVLPEYLVIPFTPLPSVYFCTQFMMCYKRKAVKSCNSFNALILAVIMRAFMHLSQ